MEGYAGGRDVFDPFKTFCVEADSGRTMADLVHSPFLWDGQLTGRIDGVLFEKVSNFVPRVQKVVVADMVFLAGSEFGLRPVRGQQPTVIFDWQRTRSLVQKTYLRMATDIKFVQQLP